MNQIKIINNEHIFIIQQVQNMLREIRNINIMLQFESLKDSDRIRLVQQRESLIELLQVSESIL